MNVALIFAGGVGARMGSSTPKQFLNICGKPILAHTLAIFQKHPLIDVIRVVTLKDYFSRVKEICKTYGISKCNRISEGGDSAQESIYRGLVLSEAECPSDTIVLIHDGVRPYVDAEVITNNIRSVQDYGNAITYTPCYETLVLSADGRDITDIPPRRMSFTAQAPQCFRLGDILEAHRIVRATNPKYTDLVDQATLLWSLHRPMHLVLGNRGNIKVTTSEDIDTLEALIAKRKPHE